LALGGKMTTLRKIVDSNTLTNVFDLPADFKNKKVEIVIFLLEEKKIPRLTMKQIEEWTKTPEIQSLSGALKTTDLPMNISINDIRNERLSEKYKV
jgi:hypothetical protein